MVADKEEEESRKPDASATGYTSERDVLHDMGDEAGCSGYQPKPKPKRASKEETTDLI